MAGTPIGRILLMSKGSYNPTATYNSLDWVRDGGKSWVCKVDGTTGITPTEGANWTLLAADGSVTGTIDWTGVVNKPFNSVDTTDDFSVDSTTKEMTIKRGTFGTMQIASGGTTTNLEATGDDTFKIIAGTNVTIAADDTTTPKEITINSSGGGTGGHNMTPAPASGLDLDDVRTAMTAAETEGSENDDVLSAWAIGQWSNTVTKRIMYNGTIAVGDNTIGTWPTPAQIEALANEANLTTRAATEASYGWWHDAHFVGIDAFDDYDLKFKYKPFSGGDIITLGGYILDTDTGYMCIKFGAPTTVSGNEVGVDISIINNGVSYTP